MNHVKLVVIQMAAHAVSPTENENGFLNKIKTWLRDYSKSSGGIFNGDAQLGTDTNSAEYHLEHGDAVFGAGTSIRDYHVRVFTLLEVINSAFPQVSELVKTNLGLNPEDNIDIMAPYLQKKFLNSLFLGPGAIEGVSESEPLRVTNNGTAKTINIPFQVQFEVNKKNPAQLAYLAFTYFDLEGVDQTAGQFSDINFSDITPSAFGEDYEGPLQNISPVLRSPGNIKHVIRNGKVNKTDTIFLKSNGKEWHGNIVAVANNTNLALGQLPLDDDEYNYAVGNVSYFTHAAFGNFNLANEHALSLIKKKESIINDFRSLRSVEKVFIEFKNYQNDILSSNLLGDLNNNIKTPERTKFSDAYLSLQPGHSNSNLYGSPKSDDEIWCAANYFFAIDIGAILEKNSVFSWAYSLPLETTPAAPDKISSFTNTLLEHTYASCRIRNFTVKRRSVQARRLSRDYAREYWEELPGEDPDCHTDGAFTVTEVAMDPTAINYNDSDMNQIVTVDQGSISYKKVSPVKGAPPGSSAESCSDFSLNPSKAMECDYNESDGVSWAGSFNKQPDNVHLQGINGQPEWPGERSKMLFIQGQDSRVPKNGKKRFQYGVEFQVVDGFLNTLKAALGEPTLSAIEVPLAGDLTFANKFQPLIPGLNKSLEKIKQDIDQGLVNVSYGETDAPMSGYPNSNFVRTAPVVDPVTYAFTEDYLNSNDTNYRLASEEIELSLKSAVASYFGLMRLFSVIPNYSPLSEGKQWQIDYGLKEIDDNFNIFETYRNISPVHGGSTKGFMLFYDMYRDLIYMIRRLVKHSGTSGNSFLMGGGAASPMGQNSNPDIVTSDPGSRKPAISDSIKVENWFQQTLLSPSYDISGYSYLPFEMNNIKNSGNLSVAQFDKLVDAECKKYFLDPAIDLPQIPPNKDKQLSLGMSSDTKHTYLTLRNVFVNGVRKNLDITPTGNTVDADDVTSNLDLTQVVYANTLLQILARAEMNRGMYPQVTVDEGKAYDGGLSKEDQILLSKILLGRSCVINPQVGNTYLKEGGGIDLDKISYSGLFTTVYDVEPLDPDDGFPDNYYEHFAPGKYGNDINDYTVYDNEKLRFSVHFMMTLVANDEFDIFKNFDISKWQVKQDDVLNGESEGLVNEILKKEKPSIELRKLPNPVKYLFEAINLYEYALITQTTNTYLSENFINNFFAANILHKYFASAMAGAGTMNALNTKESLAALYFNFFNIGKIEYLAGFEPAKTGAGGSKKYSLKSPMWKPLMAYQSANQTEPDALNSIRGTTKKLLCRVVPWDGFIKDLGQVMNLKKKYLSMPVLGQYFYITGQ
jgi:hypothetical protein